MSSAGRSQKSLEMNEPVQDVPPPIDDDMDYLEPWISLVRTNKGEGGVISYTTYFL
jgi:hypothetical protein